MIKKENPGIRTGMEIAIIGMSGRFPGAKNIHEYWDNLKNGVESLSFFSDEELAGSGVEAGVFNAPNYIKCGGAIQGKALFDASFFGYSPREAELMNPQIRMFHECAWEALEDAGYNPGTHNDKIGLYAGAANGFYWQALSHLSGKSYELGQFAASHLIDQEYLCARISYHLNLKGASSFVHTACSTSLVAIHQACRALLTGESEMILAGGVAISAGRNQGYLYREGMILSRDGHCRSFADNASGTIGGEGAGILLLKRLTPALADKDHIYAIIRGTAINNDGNRKVGFTAPSIEAQAEVIRTAQRMARVDPESVTYIEAHGTGTDLGDPVEIEALKLAFNTGKRNYCGIGSVKSNIGHLDTAAGIAGFIKTVMALKYKLIPPSLHFTTPNPKIDFENSPFYVNTGLKEWKNQNQPLRAGVSSFGIGGTNAHVVLEEAPPPQASSKGSAWKILLFSAMTGTALDQVANNFREYLKKHPGTNLADAAFTLQLGRKAFLHRRIVVGPDIEDAVAALSTPHSRRTKTFVLPVGHHDSPVIFMFPGLGAQYVNMGRELYQLEPVFRQEMDRCFEILTPLTGYKIKEILYPTGGEAHGAQRSDNPAAADIDRTQIAQLVIFSFEYALAQLLMKWGITPQAMIGYSFGEYVAACAAGVFSLEDALKLIVDRGELIEQTPGGMMLSVPLPVKELTPFLTGELAVAIDNGLSCVVAGTSQVIIDLEQRLKQRKLLCMRLRALHAIHSKMMEPIAGKFREILEHIPLTKPKIPFISNVTGKFITPAAATDPAYWTEHLKSTVQFSAGIQELSKNKNFIFVEIGPGNDLCSLLTRHFPQPANHPPVNLIRQENQNVSDSNYLMNRIGQLWLYGKNIDWQAFYSQEKRSRIPLPTYPFERQRYWIEGNPFKMSAGTLSTASATGEKTGIADWFYFPSWKRLALDNRKMVKTGKILEPSSWLVFIGEHPLGSRLVKHLQDIEQEVIIVRAALEFKRIQKGEYQVNPENRADYDTLLSEIKKSHDFPGKIIHMWGVSGSSPAGTTAGIPGYERLDRAQSLGFYSLLYLAQAIAKQHLQKELQIVLVTDDMHDVTGEENLCPGKSTALGIMKVIPQEYPYIICRSIDLSFNQSTQLQEQRWLEQILQEFTAASLETVIAYRGHYRWVQTFEPGRLDEPGQPLPGLREKGIYLITGGLGDIGLVLAKYLAKSVKARLILTGRSFFPPRDEWKKWVEKYGEENITSRKIKKAMELEDLGSEVLVFSVDVADRSRVQEIVNRSESRFGPINGIIHAAGIIKGPSIDFIGKLGKNECQQQFQAKIAGLLVLKELFWGKQLDFCLLISSIASILGGIGFAAYTAANIFMDAFIKKHTRFNAAGWVSVNWDKNNPEEIISAFTRILSLEKVNQIVFSSGGNLHTRIDKWVKIKSLREQEHPGNKDTQPPPSQSRPLLSTPYAAPGNQYQETIANIWQDFLGYEQVGIQDNFFELGGDSLKAITVISKIHKKLNVEIPIAEFFNHPTIRELAQYIDNSEQTIFHSIQPGEKKEYYPVSSAQKRFYILQQLDLESTAYNNSITVLLGGKLSKGRFDDAFKRLIARHESLKTSFHLIKDEPVQKVHEQVDFAIEYDETPGPAAGNITANFSRPLNLAKAPLLRVRITSLAEQKHVFRFEMHHLISDGISLLILTADLVGFYAAKEIPPLRLQYRDFSQWQYDRLTSGKLKEQETYWRNYFPGELPVLDIPTDYPRPPVQSFAGDTLSFRFEKELKQKLDGLIKETGTTLFITLLALYNALLANYTWKKDIIVGTTIAGRDHADLQDIIGLLIETIPIRNYPQGDKTFEDFLAEVKTNTLNAFENRGYPYGELLKHFENQFDESRNPLFDTMLIVQNLGRGREETGIEELKMLPYEKGVKKVAKLDITLEALEQGEIIIFNLEYCTKLFKKETMATFAASFKEITSIIVENKNIKLQDIKISHRLRAANSPLYDEDESEFEF